MNLQRWPTEDGPPGPLHGIKVVDFSWIAAGPLTAQWLANLGATVVRVESAFRFDLLRMSGPFGGGRYGINRSIYFNSCNANKLGITLNLEKPQGRAVARRLIDWADVLVENFTPKAMRKWELDYEHLRVQKPELIMASLATQGQTGPFSLSRSTGPMLQALCGLNHLTGWPDRGPAGAMVPYPDFVAPHFAAFAILCALDHRQRTGAGQYIDLSQFEAFVHTLDASVLDFSANGRVQGRTGNQWVSAGQPLAAPHGAYPCRPRPGGPVPDRFFVVAVFNDEDWQRFGTAIDWPDWAQDPRFATHALRCRHVALLDEALSAWSRDQSGEELVQRLQQHGVAAGMVADQQDLWEDPQLRHRGHFVPVEHTAMGEIPIEHPAVRFSGTPLTLRHPAPCIGEHNEAVLMGLLGYSEAEYDALVLEGVIEYYEGD